MKCFNCGNDADMEVFMMINGKLKKTSICMECYQEQMKGMMDAVADEDGNIDPEKIQKQMFDFFQNNREEFEQFLSDVVQDENFDMSQLRPENFDIKDMNFENTGFNLNQVDVNELLKGFSKMSQDLNEEETFINGNTSKKSNIYSHNRELSQAEREVLVLENAAKKKRAELNKFIENEEYLNAARSRDEMREINKKIMIIKQLAKESE